jgi:energy-coupling factor transporter ATP-binding protein EcfA2
MVGIQHVLDLLKTSLESLNLWTKEQPFLVALLTCGFSGFFFSVIKWNKKNQHTDNLPYWQQRGWPLERTRHDLLDRVHSEFTVRRAQGLHEEVAAELDLKLQYSQVQPTLALANQANKTDEPLPEGTSIIDVYFSTKVGKKLLILGQPGAGKTTILLELAKHLAEKAQTDEMHPVPVIFECSTWTGKAPKDWLADELKRIYHLKLDYAAKVLENGEILLLLDGLDELMASSQKAFVKQLNALLVTTHQFVICSRVAEYESIAEEDKLHLHNAVFVQPLQNHQIVEYLDKVKAPHIREVLTRYPTLMTLASSPLILNMIILCRQDLPFGPPDSTFADEYHDRILETYLNSRLTGNGASHPPCQTRHWLSWLAMQLKGRSKSEFELEDLQPTWLKKPGQFGIAMVALSMVFGGIIKCMYDTFWFWSAGSLSPEWLYTLSIDSAIGLAYGLGAGIMIFGEVFLLGKEGKRMTRSKALLVLIGGLVLGLASGLASGLAIGLAIGLASGLASGLILWFCETDIFMIKTVELVRAPHWSSPKDWMTIVSNLALVGLALGLVFGLASGLAIGLAIGLASGLGMGLASGLRDLSTHISKKVTPNQGVRRSGLNGLIFAACVSPMILALIRFVSSELHWIVVGLFFSNVAFLYCGGLAYIQHYALRFVLSRQGCIPFFYVHFLDQMVKRKLLQRIGGSYRFMHLSLRDHCAKLGEADQR